ncbi:hypothetical protein R3P38DRAFT_2765143 [Favolaschia claudopus]|uniref:Uncharacterized protein n=1 Tax=Favolaschia claudopus TaxID=2862362 RepID=A0AAW0D3A0_9AGAR
MAFPIPHCVLATFKNTNHPGFEVKQFRALQYSASGNFCASVHVPTLCSAIYSAPCVDSFFAHLDVDIWKPTPTTFNEYPLHTTQVSVDQVFSDGEVTTTKFHCVYLRRHNLPEPFFNYDGEIIIMLAEADGCKLTNLTIWEDELAERAIDQLVPLLKKFQESPQQSCIQPIAFSVTRLLPIAPQTEDATMGGGASDDDDDDHDHDDDEDDDGPDHLPDTARELQLANDARRESTPSQVRESMSNCESESEFALEVSRVSLPVVGRLYSVDREPLSVFVNTVSRYRRSYPLVERHMTPLAHAHALHDTHVRVTHCDRSGSVVTTYFCCYFRCCSSLSRNWSLGVRGEALITRMRHDDIFEFENLESADCPLADHVANVLGPKLYEYQQHGTPVGSFNTIFPGTF